MSNLPNNPIIWPAVPHDYSGDNNLGYYAKETTQRYVWGTRGMTWDGKVFKYSRAKGTLLSAMGVVNSATIDVSDLLNTNHPNTITAGDRSFEFTVTSTEGFDGTGVAKNELAGATMVIGGPQSRTIISNTAIAASTTGTITVTVDEPFDTTTTTGWCECPFNPYGYLIPGANTIGSFMGVPNVGVTTGQHVWIQTWGLCFVNPGGADTTIGDSYENREVYFIGDGSINGGNIVTIESGFQRAGFQIDATESGTGGMPMVMLQISV